MDGDWVEVTTDTRIPTIRNPSTGLFGPVYAKAPNPNDCWVSLIEKAYAKALGSYEAIPRIKIQECLTHLTGGSVQLISVNEKYSQNSPAYRELWDRIKKALSNDTLLIAMPSKELITPSEEKNEPTHESTAAHVNTDDFDVNQGIVPDHLYSIEGYREIGIIELVLLRDPWGLVHYEGEWNENSVKWDDYPDILESIYEDPNIVWRRESPKGYIWISFKEFIAFFKDIYFCKLFPDSKFNYYVSRGEWNGVSAAGPRTCVASNKDDVIAAAKASALNAFQKVNCKYYIRSRLYMEYLFRQQQL